MVVVNPVQAQDVSEPAIKPTPLPTNERLAAPIEIEETRYYPLNQDEVYISTPFSADHPGIDFASKSSLIHPKISSVESGKVIFAGDTRFEESPFGNGYGRLVVIKHDEVISLYAHLSQIDVTVGTHVSQGQETGNMGSTGNSTGTHLHFEILTDEEGYFKKLNPMEFVGMKKITRFLVRENGNN
ncbi:M23 family metallopeptidase [Candidatus Woesebacteria bacterium]|nr:M23 family metallopeptidase [Candidatus Woesebacteria bacterium]